MFNLGQVMRRRASISSTSDRNPNRPHEERFNEEQEIDQLAYRLQHLNQRGRSSGNDVDPFNVGVEDSFSDQVEVDVVKMGAVDDAGWGASNDDSDYYDDDDYNQGGDGLVLGFGGRTPEQDGVRRRQKEILSTPTFGGGGSQSTRSHWDSNEHSRRSFSTISCTKDDVNDGLADIEQQCMQMISKKISTHEIISTPLTMEQPKTSAQNSVGNPTRRTTSPSTLSSLSSPIDNCVRDIIISDGVKPSSLPTPPLMYKPKSSRTVSSKEKTPKASNQTNSSNFVEVSVVPPKAQTQEEEEEEECPRLEQLQQMTLEELKSELVTMQAQSKTNLENSWKAAERMRVENSELEKKAEGLKTKLDTAFSGPPVSRRFTDSDAKYDDFDVYDEESDETPVDRREGMLRQNLSDNNLADRGSEKNSTMKSSVSMADLNNKAYLEEDKDDPSDIIEAFTLELEPPATTARPKNMHQIENSNCSTVSGGSSEFGFFYHDMSQSVEKSTSLLSADVNNRRAVDGSESSSDFNTAQSGVYYPPPKSSFDDDDSDGEIGSNPGQNEGNTLKNDKEDTASVDDNRRSGLKRRPSMLARRPSFMGLFGLNDSSRSGSESAEGVDKSNHSRLSLLSSESMQNINGNVFHVEARSIMIEELENELKEKSDMVSNLIDEIDRQKEDIGNCELEISRLRAKIDDEGERTRSQSTLQQSVKELIQWDGAIESMLDRTEEHRQCLKQKEDDLRALLASNDANEAQCKVVLKHQRSRFREESIATQEESENAISTVINGLRGMNCDNNLADPEHLFHSLATETIKLHRLLGDSHRVATFIAMKKHIEEQRDRMIDASLKMFRCETNLRSILMRLNIKEERSDEEMSVARDFIESVLMHLEPARGEHARFALAAIAKVGEFLSWWDQLLEAESTVDDFGELGDVTRINSILERVLADVTEELAVNLAMMDKKFGLYRDKLLSAGILGQQGNSLKRITNKASNVETSNYQAELDNLNEEISSLETSLAKRHAVRNAYASTIDRLHKQDENDSRANLELLDNIQVQVRILAKKLTTDDEQIASLRQSLQEKKDTVANLEYGKKRKDIMHT